MPRKGFYSVVLLLSFVAIFSTEAKFKSTKQAMNEIFTAFVELLPYASSEMKFNDPKAEEFIKQRLLKLKRTTQCCVLQ